MIARWFWNIMSRNNYWPLLNPASTSITGGTLGLPPEVGFGLVGILFGGSGYFGGLTGSTLPEVLDQDDQED